MSRRTRMSLTGAGAGVLLLVITWYAVHYVAVVRHADVSVLRGFLELHRPGLDRLTYFVANLCSPRHYVFLAVIPVLVALVRRRPRVAVMIALVLLAANETTQLLKPLLAAPRDFADWWNPIGSASWPSGHATAAMSLALCAVIAAPARRRPMVGAAMAAFAVAVSYSFLELGWHYPSDVLGGFLVAGTWTLLGVAALSFLESRRAGGTAETARPRTATFSVSDALRPVLATIGAAALLVLLVAILRPHPVIAFARQHEVFVIGACAIGMLGLVLASGLTLMLRRS